jgi:hypothetical protein
MTDKEDTLEIWGLKKLDDNYGYISINKKNLADKITESSAVSILIIKKTRILKTFMFWEATLIKR